MECKNECCYQKQKEIEGWLTLLQEVYGSATSSVDVLNELLNYDKIESKSLSLEPTVFSMQDLLEEVSKEFRVSAMNSKIRFHLELPGNSRDTMDSLQTEHLKVVGDRVRITQVLRNLVSSKLAVVAWSYDASTISPAGRRRAVSSTHARMSLLSTHWMRSNSRTKMVRLAHATDLVSKIKMTAKQSGLTFLLRFKKYLSSLSPSLQALSPFE